MKAVEEGQRKLLTELMQSDFLSGYYLAGGTNLALRFEHRHSVDLDLFCERDFDISYSNVVNSKLKDKYGKRFTSISATEVGVFGSIDDIKTDFINIPHNLLEPLQIFEGARLASILDVAAMKINAVVGRGTQKDFYDIYELLKHYSLKEMLEAYRKNIKWTIPLWRNVHFCILRMPTTRRIETTKSLSLTGQVGARLRCV